MSTNLKSVEVDNSVSTVNNGDQRATNPVRENNRVIKFTISTLKRPSYDDEPLIREALARKELNKWKSLLKKKLEKLHGMYSWTVVPRPEQAQASDEEGISCTKENPKRTPTDT